MKHSNKSGGNKLAAKTNFPTLVNEPVDSLCSSPDEVARRAYFSYVNEGCPEGRHVQHWLDAEAQLLDERNRTRTHGFHNQT